MLTGTRKNIPIENIKRILASDSWLFWCTSYCISEFNQLAKKYIIKGCDGRKLPKVYDACESLSNKVRLLGVFIFCYRHITKSCIVQDFFNKSKHNTSRDFNSIMTSAKSIPELAAIIDGIKAKKVPKNKMTNPKIKELADLMIFLRKNLPLKNKERTALTTKKISTALPPASSRMRKTHPARKPRLPDAAKQDRCVLDVSNISSKLDLYYSSRKGRGNIKIRGNILHDALELQRIIREHSIGKANMANACISFIVSDRPVSDASYRRRFVSFPFQYRQRSNELVASIAPGSLVKNKEVQIRMLNVRNYLIALSNQHLKRQYSGDFKEFYEQNHFHSELALVYRLHEIAQIHTFVKTLMEELDVKKSRNGHKVYAVILDIHSTNTFCRHCLPMLNGLLYTHETLCEKDDVKGFINLLQESLIENGFVGPKSSQVRLIIRFSGSKKIGNEPSRRIIEVLNDDDKETLRSKTDIKTLYRNRYLLFHRRTARDTERRVDKPTSFMSNKTVSLQLAS